jgi:hypothetical protein
MHYIEYTKLSDITSKVEIHFDPHGTAIESDTKFIRETMELNDLLEDCVTKEKTPSESPWVIRLVLNAEEMLSRNLTMDDINFAIKLSEFENLII